MGLSGSARRSSRGLHPRGLIRMRLCESRQHANGRWFRLRSQPWASGLKVFQWYFSRPLWLDEEMVLLNARDRAFAELPGSLWLNQTAPLGWLALQRLLITIFDSTDRAVRALPVAFGIATVTAAAWFAARRMGTAAATLFVILCGFAEWMNFYALEAKPYSADAFWALLLPAAAIWALEPVKSSSVSAQRTLLWWSLAAIGQWLGYGAIFVTPGCAVILCVTAFVRGGWRRAATVASQGIIWLLCFAAHYRLTISYTNHSEFLREYWWWGFPPKEAGFGGTLRWLVFQLEPLASHPAGTSQWLGFWLAAIYGFVVSIRTRLTFGLVLISVPLSAFALAGLRVIPLSDRLAVWIVPSMYIAIAVAVDDVIERLGRAFVTRDWKNAILAIVVGVIAAGVCVDILQRGYDHMILRDRANHGLDDRSGLRFLIAQHQSGDVFLSTHLGLPAIWWYGHVSIADPNAGRQNPTDGAPIFEVRLVGPGAEACRTTDQRNEMSAALMGARRVAVYFGFDSRNPPGLQELVLDKLSELGRLISYRRVADEGVAAVFDLRLPPEPWTAILTRPTGQSPVPIPRPQGCIGMRQANRW